jgi:hypothetical protein
MTEKETSSSSAAAGSFSYLYWPAKFPREETYKQLGLKINLLSV